MVEPREAVGVLVVAESVVMGALVLFVGPFEAVAPVVPLLLFFAVVLWLYVS